MSGQFGGVYVRRFFHSIPIISIYSNFCTTLLHPTPRDRLCASPGLPGSPRPSHMATRRPGIRSGARTSPTPRENHHYPAKTTGIFPGLWVPSPAATIPWSGRAPSVPPGAPLVSNPWRGPNDASDQAVKVLSTTSQDGRRVRQTSTPRAGFNSRLRLAVGRPSLGGVGQIGLPGGIHPVSGTGVDPAEAPRRARRPKEHDTSLGGEAVALLYVAPSAAGDHIVPGMGAAPGAGHDMVETLRGCPAVLAQVSISSEDRPPGQGNRAAEWSFHVVIQSNHRGNHEGLLSRTPDLSSLLDHRRPVSPNQHQGATATHHREGFVSRVENQRLGHSPSQTRRPQPSVRLLFGQVDSG